MLRYNLAAIALKAFSLNRPSRHLYRWVGNHYGARQRERAGIDEYRSRGDLFIELCEKYGVGRSGGRLLEIGTGWTHWYSLYLRLHRDVRITMVDVWDNRQFVALQAAFGELARYWDGAMPEGVRTNLDAIEAAASFEELYERLGLEYVLDPRGDLVQFSDRAFQSVFSFHVLEHLPRDSIPAMVEQMARVLERGAHSIHQIGIDDHVAHYDRSASPKQYLSYSDKTWRRRFQNRVQYFNRIQLSEWLTEFERQGFQLREKIVETTTVTDLAIDPRWAGYSEEDKSCVIATLVHRRP